MNIQQAFLVLQDPVVLKVLMGATLMGAMAGSAGVILVLQGRSLSGDVVSHSTLPGVCLAWLIAQRTNSFVLVAGGFVAGLLAYAVILLLSKLLSLRNDASLSVTLSLFFGAGLVLLTYAQKQIGAGEAGLERFLFGNLSTVLWEDIYMSMIVFSCFIIFLFSYWQKLSLYLFDSSFAWIRFGPMNLVRIFIGIFLVAIIGVCLQGMGALLITSILVAPVVAARPWASSLKGLFVLSGFFGGVSCAIGAILSAFGTNIPAGPASTIVALVCILFSIGGKKWINLILRRLPLQA